MMMGMDEELDIDGLGEEPGEEPEPKRRATAPGYHDARMAAQQAAILQALSEGLPVRESCRAARVSIPQFYRWCRKYEDFRDRVREAELESRASLIRTILEARYRDWRAAAWLLERRWPEEWGRQDRLRQPAATDAEGLVGEETLGSLGLEELRALRDELRARAMQDQADAAAAERNAEAG